MAAIKLIESGLINELKELLKTNPECFNERDLSGDNLLAVASWHGRYDIALMLLEDFDMNVNDKNNLGSTAMHRACAQNHVDIAMLLYNKGANPKIKDNVRPSLKIYHIMHCKFTVFTCSYLLCLPCSSMY
jgi:ankyrin repeat protein